MERFALSNNRAWNQKRFTSSIFVSLVPFLATLVPRHSVMMQRSMLGWLCCALLIVGTLGDRLSEFYDRLSKPDAKYCEDKTKLLPDCTECIPGLEKPTGSQSCTQYISSSNQIRDEIRNLVVKRFGDNLPANRTYGLYPCKYFSLTVLIYFK